MHSPIVTLTLAVALVGFYFLPPPPSVVADTSCHTIESMSQTAQDSTRYAAPFSYHTTVPTRILSVQCEGGDMGSVVAGVRGSNTTYVYEYGYHRVGNAWRPIRFQGETRVGAWYVGTAEAMLDNMRTSGTGSVLAYVCEKVHNGWACGCADRACTNSLWQRQQYVVLPTSSRPTALITPIIKSFIPEGVSDEMLRLYADEFSKVSAYPANEVFDVYTARAIHVNAGETFAFTGYDFATQFPENTILLNEKAVARVASLDGQSLSFLVPVDTKPGLYRVRVMRNGAVTPNSVSFWVRDARAPVPAVTHVSPQIGTPEDMFTIHGSGFLQSGNTVVTTYGTFENLPSPDGRTLSFRMDTDLFRKEVRSPDHAFDLLTYVTVVHAGGISGGLEASTFTLSIR